MTFQIPENSSFSSKQPGLQLAVDSTSLGSFKLCPRKYQYEIIYGFVPRETSIHLLFGLLYHASLEFYDHKRCEGKDHEEALSLTVRFIMEKTWDKVLQKPLEMDSKEKSRVGLLRTVIWYLDQFKDDPLNTLILSNGKPAVELSFRFEIDHKNSTNEPYLLCGHMDRIIEDGPSCWVADRKTTKNTLDDNYFAKFAPDNQFSLYAFAGNIMYQKRLSGIIVDAAQITVTFSRFMRKAIPKPEPVLTEWYKDLGVWLRSMDQCAQDQYWPQNDKSCHLCSFKSICSLTPNVRERFLEGMFQKRVWNPLVVRGDV